MKISEKEFATICFITLMQNHATKSPKYIKEKSAMLDMGYFAIQRLHPTLRMGVVEYFDKWAIPFPEEAEEFISLMKS